MNIIKINFSNIISNFLKITGVFYSLIGTIISFISWEDMNIKDWHIKLIILISILLLSFLIALFIPFVKSKKKVKRNNVELTVFYGDLFDIQIKNKIVVIPVNDTFETLIEDKSVNNPLVSIESNHGKWLNKIITNDENGYTKEELDEAISKSLNEQKSLNHKHIDKDKGKCESYEIGTIANIKGKGNDENTSYFLLNVSIFNEENMAESNIKNIKIALDKLLDYYNKNGQNCPIYMPLIGTGNSRINISKQQILELMKEIILINDKNINGKINIVVFKGDKKEVSIL